MGLKVEGEWTGRTSLSKVKLNSAVVVAIVAAALLAILVTPLAVTPVAARNCGTSTYESKTASFWTYNGYVDRVHVHMRKVLRWNGYACVDYAHFMAVNTIESHHWTLDGFGDRCYPPAGYWNYLSISVPSYSPFSVVGTWQHKSGYPVDINTEPETGVGYSKLGWTATVYFLQPGTISLGYGTTYTRSWTSNFGSPYKVVFVLQDCPYPAYPEGLLRITELVMTA